jgi:hypothetical protein
MSTTQRKAVARHRSRLRRQGMVRLEVQASRGDADLIRRIARALRGDPAAVPTVRARLRQALGKEDVSGLKDLLAAAPLDGIDVARSRTPARHVEL